MRLYRNHNFETPAKKFLLFLIVLLIYLSFGFLSHNLATFNDHVAVFWPLTGFAIGLVIQFGWTILPSIFVGSFLARRGNSLGDSFEIMAALACVVEAYVGALLYSSIKRQYRFLISYAKSTAYFSTSMIAPIISASVWTYLNITSSPSTNLDWKNLWLEYWSGNTLGCFIFLPLFFELIKLIRAKKIIKAFKSYHVSLFLQLFCLLVVLMANFVIKDHSVFWLLCPAIFMFGKKTGRLGINLVVLVTSLLIIYSNNNGFGPFEMGSPSLNIIYIHCLVNALGWAALLSEQLKPSQDVLKIKNIPLINGIAWVTAIFLIGTTSYIEKNHAFEEYENTIETALGRLLQLENSVGSYLFATSAHFSVNPETDSEDWRRFHETIKSNQYPIAINGFGFIDYIDPKDPNRSMLQNWAAKRATNSPRVLDSDYSRKFGNQYVIDLIEPIEKNKPALGLDVGSEKNRREAAELAKAKKTIVATKSIQLVQDNVARPGFLIYNPTWHTPKNGGEPIFIGWSYSPVITEYFFGEAFSGYLSDLIIRAYIDGQSVYSSAEKKGTTESQKLIFKKEVSIFNQPVELSFYPTGDFFNSNNQLTSVALATLLNIILLISSLFLSEKSQFSRRLQDEVEMQTRNLSQSEQYVKSLIELAPIGIATLDSNLQFTNANKEYLSFFGYSMEELKKISVADITHPEDLHNTDNIKPDEIPRFTKLQKRYLRKDGQTVWGEVTNARISAPGVSDSIVLVILKDINEVKELEKLTFEQRSQIDQLYNALNSSALVFKTNPFGSITYANDNILQVSQYIAEDIIGNDFQIFRSSVQPIQVYQDILKTVSQGIIWNGDLNFVRKDGTSYWVNANISPVFGDHGAINEYLFILFDITAQKEAEVSLQHSAKMSSLGEMAGGIAHEINNPLTIIQGKSSQLRRLIDAGNYSPEVAKEFLSKIEQTTERISKIVKGLRMFSRDTSKTEYSPYSISQIIDDTLALCGERLHQHGITVSSSVSEELMILCNPTQISQVILNLLNNAHDAIYKTKNPWILVSARKDGNKVLISVTDSGPGIPHDLVDKIMQPFFTTKPVGVGTGLGLSISLGIIKAHAGEFKIDQQNPHTSFIVQLPAA